MSQTKYLKRESNIYQISCSRCHHKRDVKFWHGGPFGSSHELLNGDAEVNGKIVCTECLRRKELLFEGIDEFINNDEWNIITINDGSIRMKRRVEIYMIQEAEAEAQEVSEHLTCELDVWSE